MSEGKDITIGIIVASDRCSHGEAKDESIPIIEDIISKYKGLVIKRTEILPDEQTILGSKMIEMADVDHLDLVLTTGGTGFSKRDVTPEATLDVIMRRIPGIPEAMRMKSLELTDRAMLARQEAGIRGDTIIINLPGSPKAIWEILPFVMPAIIHGVKMLAGEGH